MANEIENADSLNGDENVNSEIDGQSEEDNSKESEPEYSERERKLFERVKKSEGEKKILREQLKKYQPSETSVTQSNEPDYAKIAFLEQRGISHPDDQKIVQDEASRLKLPLTDILQMAHIKSKLETTKDQRESQDGMPKGKGKGSGTTKGDVDYWLAKGETPDDQELAEKVIAARIHKETQGNKFSEELYTG
jgi:hypothetical protein